VMHVLKKNLTNGFTEAIRVCFIDGSIFCFRANGLENVNV
jgi:hypothetical protein